jgi:hypothetical protein
LGIASIGDIILTMTTVREIKEAIEKLSLAERGQLERWLHGWEDDAWDRQISADASAGKLDAMLREVDRELDSDQLRELP